MSVHQKNAQRLLQRNIAEYGRWLRRDLKLKPGDKIPDNYEIVPNDTRRLLFVPKFNHRESLLGYLMRLNQANHYNANSIIITGGQITHADEWTDEYRRIATGRFNLPNLARLLGVGASDVYLMTYTVSEEISTSSQGKILIDSLEYPLELIRLQRPRFCVECFKADKKHPDKYPYHRRLWDFAHYTVCTKHYTLLEDTCPSCKKQISWARQKLTECQCGYDLCKIKPIKVPLEHTFLSARVAYSLEDEPDPDEQQIAALENGFFKKVVEKISPEDPDPTGHVDDPVELADEIYERELEQRGYNRKATRFSFSHMPNEMLHRHFVSLYPDLFGDSVISYREENYPITTKHQIADMIGMSVTTVYKFMDAFPPTNGDTYDKADLVYLAGLYKKLIPTKKTCEVLQIKKHFLQDLSEAAILNPLFGPSINGYGDYLYHQDSVLALMDKLNAKVQQRTGIKRLVALRDYDSIGIKSRWPHVKIIQKILEGSMLIYDFDKAKGLYSATIDYEDLVRLNTVDQVASDLLSIDDVAERLSIYPDAVYRTLKTGLLSATKLVVNKAVKSFITTDNFDNFHANFVFVNEIATEYDTGPTSLAAKIASEGIEPVSGPGIDNNLLFIFPRKAVEKLDMEAVIQKTDYQNRAGRPKKGTPSKWDDHPPLHDAGAIAEFLGTTIQKVSRLAKNGFLEPYDHKGLLGNKRFFEVTQFKAYLNKYRDNPDLIAFEDALSVIGETDLQFKANWVKSKRIAFIEDGLDGRYLDLKQLDALCEFKKHAISTRDAAEQMGVDRSVIQNKHKLGHLKPISGSGIDEFGNFFYAKNDVRALFAKAVIV